MFSKPYIIKADLWLTEYMVYRTLLYTIMVMEKQNDGINSAVILALLEVFSSLNLTESCPKTFFCRGIVWVA